MKYKVREIARKWGYKTRLEMQSPLYMSFIPGNKKEIIDVWCEYYEKRNNNIYGRQIPIEIYYSEIINYIKGSTPFHINPNNSFRCIISNNIKESYTLTKEVTKKYFDTHIINWNDLYVLGYCFQIGKQFLIEGFVSKIDNGECMNIAGLSYGELKNNFDIWYKLKSGIRLKLKREPNNKYDSNAIKVYYKNIHLGYIPKEYAKYYAPIIDDGEKIFCIVDWKLIDSYLGVRLLEKSCYCR